MRQSIPIIGTLRIRRTMARCVWLAVAGLVAVASLPTIVAAQVISSSGSYLTPFPDGERYRLRVIGDEYGEGIHAALIEGLGSDPRIDVEKKPIWLSGMTRPNSVE
ncbi:MAG: hypothetical protein ACK5KM_09010 [Hyphomicrobiaceae bacterium]